MDFDALRVLEPDFWRTPSARNTQPWVLRYRERSVEIGWDPSRTLPAADPTGRDLRLALGAFAETCLIVCADAGFDVKFRQDHVEFLQDHVGFRQDHDDTDHPRIGRLIAAKAPYTTPFTTQDVRDRHTGRGAYEPGRLDEAVFARLENLAAEEKAELRRLRTRELIGLLHTADHHLFSTPPLARELREWMRLDPKDPRYEQDGLTDRALGLSRREARRLRVALSRREGRWRLRAALSPRAHPLLRRHGGVSKHLARASLGTLDYDGEVIVLLARPGCGESEQVALGRVLMRQWLTLSTFGYTTHPLSRIIDVEVAKQRLACLLDVDDPSRLAHIARVGRPLTSPPHSARLRSFT